MHRSESGFTLVELLVSMAMAGIVVGIIYAAYTIQTKIYTEQGKVAEMQQNIRAAVTYLRFEGVMAGYNPRQERHVSCGPPGGGTLAKPGVHTATATAFGFSMDLNRDGDCADTGENVTYTVYPIPGPPPYKLGRNDNTDAAAQQPVAEDITGIQFIYLFEPPEGIGTPGATAPTSTPLPADLDELAAVQVTLLAQGSASDRKRPVTQNFIAPVPDAWGQPTANPPVWQTFTDTYSRRQLTTTINLRNMGL